MQHPSEKHADPTLSPGFVHAVHDQLLRYDGMRAGSERPCPGCAATTLRKNGYQAAGKTFARLVTDDGFETVTLEVQLYECKQCGRSFQGDLSEFFYADCAYARPIVDLCLFHVVDHSCQSVERILGQWYGLQVDRDTIERYDQRHGPLSTPREHVSVDGSELSVPFLAFLFGESGAESHQFAVSRHTALW